MPLSAVERFALFRQAVLIAASGLSAPIVAIAHGIISTSCGILQQNSTHSINGCRQHRRRIPGVAAGGFFNQLDQIPNHQSPLITRGLHRLTVHV